MIIENTTARGDSLNMHPASHARWLTLHILANGKSALKSPFGRGREGRGDGRTDGHTPLPPRTKRELALGKLTSIWSGGRQREARRGKCEESMISYLAGVGSVAKLDLTFLHRSKLRVICDFHRKL